MFAAAAAAASGGHRGPRFLFNNPKRPGGLESPPHSLDNRSTPGSLDLSRSKDEYYDEADDAPPTMVKMEAMVYPKIDSEDEEEHRRLEKRIFPNEENDDDEDDDSEDYAGFQSFIGNYRGLGGPKWEWCTKMD